MLKSITQQNDHNNFEKISNQDFQRICHKWFFCLLESGVLEEESQCDPKFLAIGMRLFGYFEWPVRQGMGYLDKLFLLTLCDETMMLQCLVIHWRNCNNMLILYFEYLTIWSYFNVMILSCFSYGNPWNCNNNYLPGLSIDSQSPLSEVKWQWQFAYRKPNVW